MGYVGSLSMGRWMQIYYCDHFVLPLPAGHRFPMEKYALLRERVAETASRNGAHLTVPDAATDVELKRVHTDAYVDGVTAGTLTAEEVRRIGFPWSPELVERSRRSVGGTLASMRSAMTDGVSINLAGGTHHAFAGHGEGFCVFNDVAVAIRAAEFEGRARRFAVLDFDVHQGNGTAEIFANHSEAFTVSVHGESNYPFKKTRSDVDIGLADGAGDDAFLDATRTGVARAFDEGRPDLVFYVAGADAHAGDRLGRLDVTKAGLAERDRIVIARVAAAGTPLVVVMAGGYGTHVEDTVDIHHHSVLAALHLGSGGLASELTAGTAGASG